MIQQANVYSKQSNIFENHSIPKIYVILPKYKQNIFFSEYIYPAIVRLSVGTQIVDL